MPIPHDMEIATVTLHAEPRWEDGSPHVGSRAKAMFDITRCDRMEIACQLEVRYDPRASATNSCQVESMPRHHLHEENPVPPLMSAVENTGSKNKRYHRSSKVCVVKEVLIIIHCCITTISGLITEMADPPYPSRCNSRRRLRMATISRNLDRW